jgi:YHS domain-containing protein
MLKLMSITALLAAAFAFGSVDAMAKDAPAKKPVNKTCPVGGEEVDPSAGTFEYKGKTYGVCCEKCIAKFKANPEKYEKNLKSDAK